MWQTGSSVEDVKARSYMSGYYYSPYANVNLQVPALSTSIDNYSNKYNDMNWRKEQAVFGCTYNLVQYNTIGDVQYKYGDTTKITHVEDF